MRGAAAAALALLASTAFGDTLVFRNGTHADGKLTFCDEETCVLGKRRIPLADIAQIILRPGFRIPPAARMGSILLTDGTMRTGRFTGLNLGYVDLDESGESESEIEREDVGAILLATPAGSRTGEDVLIGADGTARSGSLDSCNPASCTLDGATVPLQSIRWIGLQQEGEAPPAADDAAGVVILRDESRIDSVMTAVSGSSVRTTHGSFPRAQVAWIHVAAQSTVRPPKGGGTAQEESPPSEPGTPSQPSPARPAPPGATAPSPGPAPSSSSPQAARSNLTKGALWTGTIRAHLWSVVDGDRTDLFVDVDARLREFNGTMKSVANGQMKKVGTFSILEPEGSTITNRMKCVYRGGGCSGQGTTTVTSTPDESGFLHPSIIYHKTEDGSMMYPYGFELERGQALYMIGINGLERYDVDYGGPNGVTQYGYIAPVIGRTPIGPQPESADPQLRYVSGGRMTGSFTVPLTAGAYGHLTATWSICREGVACPPAAPFPDEDGSPSTSADEHNPCDELQQLIKAMRELLDAYKQFDAEYKNAVTKRDASRDAIWGPSGALRKFFTSLLSLAGKAESAVVQRAISLSKTLMNMSGEGNSTDMYNAAKAMGYGPDDLLKNAAAKAAVNAAVQRADEYLAQTGDDQGALRLYASSIERSDALAGAAKKVTTAIGILTSAKDYADKTSALADLIQNWLDANNDATRAQGQMDDINDRQRDLQSRIDEKRSQLTGPCPTALLESPSRTPIAFASKEDAVDSMLFIADSAGAPDAQSIQAELRATAARFNVLPADYEAAATWLLPFLFGEADHLSPRLRAALLGNALPHLESIQKTLDAAGQDPQQLEQNLRRAVPEKDDSQKPSRS